LINSIKKNSPECNLYVRLVNVDDDQLFDIWSTGIQVVSDRVFLNNSKNKIKSLSDNQTSFWKGDIPKRSLLYSDEISYTCHSRFKNILELLDNGIDNIFCVDVDFIVRGNISELSNLENDIHIKHTETTNGIEFKDEDAIFVKNTKRSKEFFSEVYSKVNSNVEYWDADTIALNETYEMMKSNVKIHQLDLKYKDYELCDDSPVWSGDGGAKFTDKFIVENRQYSL